MLLYGLPTLTSTDQEEEGHRHVRRQLQYTETNAMAKGCATMFQESNIINRCTDCYENLLGKWERPQLWQRLVPEKSSMELGLEAQEGSKF